MASEVKADKLSPSTGTALQLGDASDTITIPTGATLTITDGLGVAGGGTGLTSFTAGDVLYASGTTTLAKLAKGTAEQVLAMNSGATAPDWGSVDLTVLPTITAAKGGTGQTSYTAGDIVYASGTTAVSKLGVGTARQALQTNSGATAPEWVASPQSLMTAAGDILYASGANTLAKLAKGSNDEVLTLAAGVPSWAEASGGGLTEADLWRVTATVTSNGGLFFDANWERADTAGQTVLGSGMSESSGIFTFPSTGYWLITFQSEVYSATVSSPYQTTPVYTTTDDSTYVNTCQGNSNQYAGFGASNAYSQSGPGITIFDVASTSLCKVKFQRQNQATVSNNGSTSQNLTYAVFIRLADT